MIPETYQLEQEIISLKYLLKVSNQKLEKIEEWVKMAQESEDGTTIGKLKEILEDK